MTSRDSDVLKTDISFGSVTIPTVQSPVYHQTRLRFTSHNERNIKTLCKILKRLAGMDLPGKDHVEGYLRHLTWRNRRPKTLYSRWGGIVLFLGMIRRKRGRC